MFADTEKKLIWKNGSFEKWNDANVHILSHTLHYGTGVFEGVRAYETPTGPAIFRLREHTNRLFNAADRINIKIPFSEDEINNVQCEVLNKNNLNEGYIRPIVYLGNEGLGLRAKDLSVNVAVAAWEWPSYMDPQAKEIGISVIKSSHKQYENPLHSGNKIIGTYFSNTMALHEAIDNGADEWAPTDDRFTDEDLLEREASMGRSNYMLQFQLDTSLSDAEKFPLKMADLIITSVNPDTAPENIIWCSDPANVIKDAPTVGLPGDYFYSPMQMQGEWAEYDETICSIDPSGRGTDETAACYLSQRNGIIYLHEVRAYRDGYSDNTLLDILKGCKKYGVSSLVIETNFGDGIVSELFKKHLIQTRQNIHIEEVRANVRKEDRIIDSLEPVLNQHRLVVNRSVIDWDYASNKDSAPESRLLYMLFYQMSRMCRQKGAVKHDDRLDSLAGAVQYWNESLAIDEDRAMKEREAELWELEMAAYKGDIEGLLDAQILGVPLEKVQRQNAKSGWIKTHGNH